MTQKKLRHDKNQSIIETKRLTETLLDKPYTYITKSVTHKVKTNNYRNKPKHKSILLRSVLILYHVTLNNIFLNRYSNTQNYGIFCYMILPTYDTTNFENSKIIS